VIEVHRHLLRLFGQFGGENETFLNFFVIEAHPIEAVHFFV
jgi:hypothetical protein